jgi:hypothetical protein
LVFSSLGHLVTRRSRKEIGAEVAAGMVTAGQAAAIRAKGKARRAPKAVPDRDQVDLNRSAKVDDRNRQSGQTADHNERSVKIAVRSERSVKMAAPSNPCGNGEVLHRVTSAVTCRARAPCDSAMPIKADLASSNRFIEDRRIARLMVAKG